MLRKHHRCKRNVISCVTRACLCDETQTDVDNAYAQFDHSFILYTPDKEVGKVLVILRIIIYLF